MIVYLKKPKFYNYEECFKKCLIVLFYYLKFKVEYSDFVNQIREQRTTLSKATFADWLSKSDIYKCKDDLSEVVSLIKKDRLDRFIYLSHCELLQELEEKGIKISKNDLDKYYYNIDIDNDLATQLFKLKLEFNKV